MKKLNLTRLNFLLLIVLVVFLMSCNPSNKANVDRAVGVFFNGVLQVINMMFFGVAALILCILSATNEKPIYKILGWTFFGIFTLFALMGLMAVTDLNPRHNDIYLIFLMEAAMIITSLIFVLKKPALKQKQQAVDSTYLDNVINDKDEIV